jgi:hypothetical protein
MTEAFNPLAMNNLAHSIVTRMLETDPTPLDAVPRFVGAGLYAIYYYGSFRPIQNCLGVIVKVPTLNRFTSGKPPLLAAGEV